MEYKYNDESLKRHGVLRKDADEVLAEENILTRDFELQLSVTGETRVMFVGFNEAGRLLEVAVEFQKNAKPYIFHAQTASPKFRKLYEDKINEERISNE
jgi:uncharacterized DUF497 family protein